MSRPAGRVTPTELAALAAVMRAEGIADLATTDLRIVMRHDAPLLPRSAEEAPLRPVDRQRGNTKAEIDEDDELMYASVT